MKVIILLSDEGRRLRPHTWSRPKPLLQVAGNTILGHMLDLMKAVTTEEVIFVVGRHGDLVQAWIKEHYSHLKAHFVEQEGERGPAHAVWLCRQYIENDPAGLLLADGNGLSDADYNGLATLATNEQAEAVLYVQREDDPADFMFAELDQAGAITGFAAHATETGKRPVLVGLAYFHSGRLLWQTADRLLQQEAQTDSPQGLVDIYMSMLALGRRLITRPVRQWSDTGRPQTLLATNARMLAIGYHSAEAIERSYAEEFLVIPPVYLHPQATVKNAVIGPYATIGAHALVKDAIVRKCIIDAGAEVQQCILENALVGEQARVTGRADNLFIGDQAQVHL